MAGQIDRSRVTDIQEISGNGVIGQGGRPRRGRGQLTSSWRSWALPYIACHSVGTIIHMAIDGQYAGHIVISDVVKPHAKAGHPRP